MTIAQRNTLLMVMMLLDRVEANTRNPHRAQECRRVKDAIRSHFDLEAQ